MDKKNKVKKNSFTELYLIDKKTYNVLKKKQQNKKEIVVVQKPSFYPLSQPISQYQTHHHYRHPSYHSQQSYPTQKSENEYDINIQSESNSVKDDRDMDFEEEEDHQNIQNLARDEHFNESLNNEIFYEVPQNNQNQDLLETNIIQPQEQTIEIVDYTPQNNKNNNIRRDRQNTEDRKLKKDVLRKEKMRMVNKKIQTKSRERKIGMARQRQQINPVNIIAPPISVASVSTVPENPDLRVVAKRVTFTPLDTNKVYQNTKQKNTLITPILRVSKQQTPSLITEVSPHAITTNENISRSLQTAKKRQPQETQNMVVVPQTNEGSEEIILSGLYNDNGESVCESCIPMDTNSHFQSRKRITGFSHFKTPLESVQKIPRKNKVLIIEKTNKKKSKNSDFVDKILQSNVNDPYDVFQFSKTAKITYAGLKRKFNAYSRKLHPDKEASPGAHEAFIIMNRAYIQLKKEIQFREELEKERNKAQKKQTSTQTGFGIKKWLKLCK